MFFLFDFRDLFVGIDEFSAYLQASSLSLVRDTRRRIAGKVVNFFSG